MGSSHYSGTCPAHGGLGTNLGPVAAWSDGAGPLLSPSEEVLEPSRAACCPGRTPASTSPPGCCAERQDRAGGKAQSRLAEHPGSSCALTTACGDTGVTCFAEEDTGGPETPVNCLRSHDGAVTQSTPVGFLNANQDLLRSPTGP